MKKDVIRLTITIFLIFSIFISMFTCVFSLDNSGNANFDISKIESDPVSGEAEAEAAVMNIAQGVVVLIRVVGFAIGIIILLVIGMKYAISSAGDRADIKKHAVNYVIAAIIFISASAILGIINDFVGSNLKIE